MIPNNAITPASVATAFLPPEDEGYTPLRQAVRGGVALNNPSSGRNFQNWEITYVAGVVRVNIVGQSVVFSLAVADVSSVSLTFDINMKVALCYMTPSGAHLYYFNTGTAAFTTLDIAGASSCKVCVDDTRSFNSTLSDVIFAYVLGGVLYWTQGRDGYTIPRVIGGNARRLEKMGRSSGARLQFELN